jgi:uncharacterized protein (TIGR02300 family)
MSKPARGTKRVCPSCGARFYDLNRSPPITCPVCQAVYQLSPPTSRRSERAQPVEVKKVVEPEADAPVLESADIISLEEVEETGADPAVEEEEIVDLGDDAPEIPAGDDDNAFLEEEEEGEADVTGIVGTPGEET